MPSSAVWEADGERLTPETPVTLSRTDEAGITYKITFSIDENYMIQVEQAVENASEAAAIVQPYVAEEIHWVIRHHGVFQSYYYAHHLGGDRDAREQYRGHRWAGLCEEFCERWDQNSFDPDFPIHPLESFEDEVREFFGRVAWDPSVVTVGSERLT